MGFDWINKVHPTNQMSYITQSKEEQIRELETHMKRLQEELRHTREQTRRVQAHIDLRLKQQARANSKYIW